MSSPTRAASAPCRAFTYLMCLLSIPAILNMLIELAGRTFLSFASGWMMRPLLSLFFLMYPQTAFVISGRDILFLPVIEARSAESDFDAKRPIPLARCLAAFFLPDAMLALLLCWPLARLPPGKRTFLAFFFLRFFFGFLAFFFFFFFFVFFAFFFFGAFLAAFFLGDFFAAFLAAFLAGFFFAATFVIATTSGFLSIFFTGATTILVATMSAVKCCK